MDKYAYMSTFLIAYSITSEKRNIISFALSEEFFGSKKTPFHNGENYKVHLVKINAGVLG